MSDTASTFSTGSSSSYRERTSRILNKAYESANSIARENQGKNRGLAAGTAAALLSLGIDKVNNDKEVPYTDEEIDAIKEMAESSDQSSQGTNSHFVDKLLDRMIKHTMNDGSIETEALDKRINDQERAKRSGLSIRILTSNFKRLSSKMTGFFALQYGLIHIITWRKPTKTLCILFAYTSICLWPHLVLAYPLVFVMFGILLPGYAGRHPMQNVALIKVKKRGQSIWEFFTDYESSSIVDDLLDDEYLGSLEHNNNLLKPMHSRSSSVSSTFSLSPSSTAGTLTLNTPEEVERHKEKKEQSLKAKKQINLFMNMRDLQNLTTDVLKGMDKGEKAYFDIAGFKDEKLSTLIFYGLLVATSTIVIFGKFIPWRIIFIQSGWSIILLCHPNSKKYIKMVSGKKKDRKPPLPPRPGSTEPVKPKPSHLDRSDIIVDDAPEIRFVEVFELQCRSPTSSSYTPYNFSTRLFDIKDKVRLSGKTPTGVKTLNKVSPPGSWKFEISFANAWVVDKEPKLFLTDRGINHKAVFHIKDNEQDGWIYDNNSQVADSDLVFRRRRLFRECYRYARGD